MHKLTLFISLFITCFAFGLKAETSELHTEHGEVKKGQGLYQAMHEISIDNALSLELINALRDEVEFSKLKVGDELEASFGQDKKLMKFSFSQNPAEKHTLTFNENSKKWDYALEEEKTYWFTRMIVGKLKEGSTLQNDLLEEGLKPSVVNEVVNVLLLKVNFRMNARIEDKFKVLLSERKLNDTIIQTKVLYTSYNGKLTGLQEAFLYQDADKTSTYNAHYTEDGQALISSGLRYPLPSLHVRSGFGWRRHPVTGKQALHQGVDLRGKYGTPVHAVADGRVVESGFNPFAGNKVAIKHRDGSTSYYLHLSKRGVRRGDLIKSHQVIGLVGATGRVTGPHLHFGFKTPQGHWMNPLNKRMIATPRLSGVKLRELKKQIAETKGLMIDLKVSKSARYLLADIPNLQEDFQLHWDFLGQAMAQDDSSIK